MKNKDKSSKPSSAGRVAGKGLSTKWSSYYTASGRKEKKTSSESQSREVQELKAQVARIPEIVQEQVQQQLGTMLNGMVPTLIHGLTTWIAGGQQGLPRFPASRPATRTTRRRRHWCLRRRREHWSSTHPGVRRIRRTTPRQQAAPPSLACPLLAVP